MSPAPKKGGISRGTYVMIAAGSVGAYLIYRWYQNRQAAASTATAAGEGATPSGNEIGASQISPPASLDAWIQAAIGAGQYSSSYTNANLYNDIQAWLNGNCVSAQGFQQIGNFIATLGLPPGYTPPNLTACPSTPTAPAPGTPTAGPTTPTTPPKTVGVPNLNLVGPSGLWQITSPGVSKELAALGYYIVSYGGHQYYNPSQGTSNSLVEISTPALEKALTAAGFKITTQGGHQYYNPSQAARPKAA